MKPLSGIRIIEFAGLAPAPFAAMMLLSVIIMLAGVTLFIRLGQTIFRPHKVFFPCPRCGLQRHEPDAVHCKACGHLLNIPDEGD